MSEASVPSSDSVIGQVGGLFGGGQSAITKTVINAMNTPGAPAPPSPPNLQNATQDAVNAQMKQEAQMRASATLFTGGSGLLDMPNTASRTLLGN